MFNLPTEAAEFEDLMPSRLVLGSHQGTGKTAAATLLPNCLVLDLESGSEGYGGMTFNLKKEMEKWNIKNPGQKLNLLGAWNFAIQSIKDANEKAGRFVYDFIAIDTTSAMQAITEMKATTAFNKGVVGQGMAKKRDGELVKTVITELPDGAGYMWFFSAWEEMYSQLDGLVDKGVIFFSHTKQGSMVKNGQNVAARDLDLLGKSKLHLLRNVQASGFLYRKDANTVMATFMADEKDLTTKSRCKHLANKEFEFSKLNPETGELTVYWNLIYPDWIKEPITKKVQ